MNIKEQLEIKDFRKEIISYLNKEFKGNENFVKIVESSVFCSEDNQIINDEFQNYKKSKNWNYTSNRWWLMLHIKIIDIKENKIKTSVAEAFIKSSSYGASIIFNGTVRNINENKEVVGITYDSHDELVLKSFDEIYKETTEKLKIIDKAVFIEHIKGYVDLVKLVLLLQLLANIEMKLMYYLDILLKKLKKDLLYGKKNIIKMNKVSG